MLHRTRHMFIRQQTALINSIRAHLAEFGIVAPVGRSRVTELLHIVADPKDKRSMLLNVRIYAHDVAFGQQGDHSDAQLRIAVVGYLRGGLVEGSRVIPFDVHYSAEEREKARSEGIVFSRSVPVSYHVGRVRLIVFGRGSNAIGSLTFPFKAPAQ